jgi:hypothetical protein
MNVILYASMVGSTMCAMLCTCQDFYYALSVMSHPVLEGKPNANHVCARIKNSRHSDYITGHLHTLLKVNSGNVLYYNKMSKKSIESIT